MTQQETELLMRMIGDLRDDITRRMDSFDERFDQIDRRLDAGDRRFAAADKRAAEIRGMGRVALWIGSAVLTTAGAVGYWAVNHADRLLALVMGRG